MRSLWRPVLDRIVPYEAGPSLEALERQLGVEALVRLSANESPLGPSPSVIEALRREAARVHLYPDGGSTALRTALGQWLGVGPEWLIAGNGAEGIRGAPAALRDAILQANIFMALGRPNQAGALGPRR